jgi:hypothetical protein
MFKVFTIFRLYQFVFQPFVRSLNLRVHWCNRLVSRQEIHICRKFGGVWQFILIQIARTNLCFDNMNSIILEPVPCLSKLYMYLEERVKIAKSLPPFPPAAAWIRPQVRPCGIYGGWYMSEISPSTTVSPTISHSIFYPSFCYECKTASVI